MSKLTGKIKNIFGHKEKSEATESRKDESLRDRMWGVTDISRSIRETGKFQVRANPWRNIFFFLIAAAIILFALSYVY